MRALYLSKSSLVVALLLTSSAVAQPTSYIKTGMPDLDQRNPSRPSGGNFYCAPTAAANSLQWFDNRGIDIVDGDPNALTDTLAGLFNTNANNGTWNDDLVKGMRNYLWGRFLRTGRLWDVKFQGGTWTRGYTVGQVAPTPTLPWIKSELADDEDLLLSVQWYTKNAAGNYVPGGGHTITASGFLGDDLLISDPWYPELIIEPANVPGVPGPAYQYSTDPNNPGLIAVIRDAISISPKDLLTLDGLIDSFEYVNPPIGPVTTGLYKTDYIDYLSLGIDFKTLLAPLTPTDVATIELLDRLQKNGLRVTYNNDGLLDARRWDPDPLVHDFTIPLPPEFARVMSALGHSPDDPTLPPHLQSEIFINKEGLGDFPVESFFDITYRVDFSGIPGPEGLLGQQLLSPQQASLDPPPWGGPVPLDYPNMFPPNFDPIETDLRHLAEVEIFAMASDFNHDGVVDAADYVLWREVEGALVPSGQVADADFNGLVNINDYYIWRMNFGREFFLVGGEAVPEPSILVLLVAVLIAVLPMRGNLN